jgi:hypothetical protein
MSPTPDKGYRGHCAGSDNILTNSFPLGLLDQHRNKPLTLCGTNPTCSRKVCQRKFKVKLFWRKTTPTSVLSCPPGPSVSRQAFQSSTLAHSTHLLCGFSLGTGKPEYQDPLRCRNRLSMAIVLSAARERAVREVRLGSVSGGVFAA